MNGNEIKKFRTQIGATQNQLAELFGVSAKTIQYWEGGSIEPSKERQTIINILINNIGHIVLKENKIFINNSLGLDDLTAIPEGFAPTVGGSLWLNGLTAIPEGFAPTVGGSLGLNGLTAKCINLSIGYNPEKEYVYADRILTHVKRVKEIEGYIWYIGKIKGRDVVFDGDNYAHCKNLKEGIADLNFKRARDRGAEQYKNIASDQKIETEKMIVMYRIITGACQAGTQYFLDRLNPLKDFYTPIEVTALTKGQYGNDTFKRFFNL